jgi:GTP-binding protein Era
MMFNSIPADFKSGFVAIIGKPNTGKSTLMNLILGEKLSITSAKPQTTRYAIKGIWNSPKHQIVFIDTPGFLKPRYEMQEKMMRIWSDAFKDVDLIIFLAQIAGFPSEFDLEVLDKLKHLKNPQLAVFNKLDLSPDANLDELKQHLPASITECLMISAKTGENIPELLETIKKYTPYHEPYYDEDQLSDLPMRFFAKETIREAIFHQFEQEIPYATAVIIERYTEMPDKVVIDAVIWLERQSQKPIIIGKKGDNLKRIREYAEKDLSSFLQQEVQIHLWIKINPNWRKKGNALRELGFDQ